MDFKKLKGNALVYAGIIILFLIPAALSYFRVFDNYELETLDIRFKSRPQIPANENIIIIEIADDTIEKLGMWPISRRYHATLLKALAQSGAKVVIFDAIFPDPSEEKTDEKFRQSIVDSKVIYLPHVFRIIKQSHSDVPIADGFEANLHEKFRGAPKGIGFINIIPDADGKYRRIPPFIKYNDVLYPHISILAFAEYMDIDLEDIKVKPAKELILGDQLHVPLDLKSNIIVNYPGRWEKTFRHYSYVDILESYISPMLDENYKPSVDLSTFKDSICFIGITATATPDAHPSPFDPMHPGVGVHASIFNSLLLERFVHRASRITNIVMLLFLCAITCGISMRTKTFLGFFLIFLFILGYVTLALALFILNGLWLDIICPILVVMLVYLAAMFMKYMNETHKREILEKELSIAKKIQESFLPKESPKVEGFEIAAKMSTARQVGGDLYDFVAMQNKYVGVMIGDVSGKGVPAALYMAKVVSEFKSYIGEENACHVISKLNSQLCRESGSGLFVTLSYIIFDTSTGFFSYSTGGHLPMIMIRKSLAEPQLIDLKIGTPLGLFEGDFEEKRMKYEKGDTFILYTDGVTEAMNTKGEMFGEDRLVDLIRRNSNLPTGAIVELVQGDVKKFESGKKQHDDITVIAVKLT